MFNFFKRQERVEKPKLNKWALVAALIAFGAMKKQFTEEGSSAIPDKDNVALHNAQKEMDSIFAGMDEFDKKEVLEIATKLQNSPEYGKMSQPKSKEDAKAMIKGMIVLAGMQIEDLKPGELEQLKNISDAQAAEMVNQANQVAEEIIEPSGEMEVASK